MNAVVCGIDPGLGTTGYAVVRSIGPDLSVLDAGVCRFDPKDSLPERLVAINREITNILCEYHPQVLAVEALYAHYRHPRTAIMMAHARGVILVSGAKLGIEVRSYEATRVKRHLTGNGRAAKEQMQKSIQTRFALADLPEPSDLADALALALCCIDDLQKTKPSEILI